LGKNKDELGRVVYKLEERFGPLTIMKHGDVTEDGGTTMSVRHDHTHLFEGVRINVLDYLRDQIDAAGITFKIIENAHDLAFIRHIEDEFKGHPYIYVQQKGLGLFIDDSEGQLGTQQIQRAMQRYYNNGMTFNLYSA
jgi:hypothetical protein